jgi:hypothetical protein
VTTELTTSASVRGGRLKSPPPTLLYSARKANEVYYFDVAQGQWLGSFTFTIIDYRSFWNYHGSVTNKALALTLHLVTSVAGSSTIISEILSYPDEGGAGVNRSKVWVKKFGLCVYRMEGEYILDPDGTHVRAHLHEQFGPVPFLFQSSKDAIATITGGGLRSTYHMPLLGASWVGNYEVSADRNRVTAVYECSWGRAREDVTRVAGSLVDGSTAASPQPL